MKNNINFTRGEWVAALALLAFTMAGYLFYYLYDRQRLPQMELGVYAAQFESFNQQQALLSDSLAKTKAARWHPDWSAPPDTTRKRAVDARKPLYDIVRIDINRCDTDDIVVVPLFGSKRAARLVEYRDRLGGFYSLEQIREVYVLQDMDMEHVAKYFTLRPGDVRKININTASYKELVSHPYFDAYLAKTILNFREKHGKIDSFEQLQQITHAYPELMEKLRHYIVFE
ncbi:MAG: helix-hairpin-helix domain-containing protein [Bacteroidales bacterium]|nr:helix-hairpin-helix domain-containing protein [Bacteroidales bacterium]